MLSISAMIAAASTETEVAHLVILAPEGPIQKDVDRTNLLHALSSTSLNTDNPTIQDELCVWYCGPDAGGVSSGGASCDKSSAWVWYLESVPTTAFTQLIPTGASGPVFCGELFGKAYEWELVELSSTRDVYILSQFVEDGCYSVDWQLHADGYCPHSLPDEHPLSPVPDTFLVSWRGRGWGIPISFNFGSIRVDYFIGLNTTECYDLPSGFPTEHFACP